MKKILTVALGLSALFSASVMAENHEIDVNVTKFVPLIIQIAPGDTVSWTNMTGHISESIDENLPEGAEGWMSEMGENFQTAPLTVEGVYPYKCTPHWGVGMGGVIIVGEPTNMDALNAGMKDKTIKGALKRLVKKANKFLAAAAK